MSESVLELLKSLEWIWIWDGDGQRYQTCPACFADRALRGGHTVWCPLEQALREVSPVRAAEA